jgi:hypothetical protein
MGLFDAIREKASELLSGATEKVEEVTGNLPGEQAIQDVSETASGAVSDTVSDAAGSVTETAETAAEEVDRYRP